MRVRTPVEAQEAARLLYVHGCWRSEVTRDAIEQGVRCVIDFPAYRNQVYADAYARAVLAGKGLLAASLTDARDVLALNDQEEP